MAHRPVRALPLAKGMGAKDDAARGSDGDTKGPTVIACGCNPVTTVRKSVTALVFREESVAAELTGMVTKLSKEHASVGVTFLTNESRARHFETVRPGSIVWAHEAAVDRARSAAGVSGENAEDKQTVIRVSHVKVHRPEVHDAIDIQLQDMCANVQAEELQAAHAKSYRTVAETLFSSTGERVEGACWMCKISPSLGACVVCGSESRSGSYDEVRGKVSMRMGTCASCGMLCASAYMVPLEIQGHIGGAGASCTRRATKLLGRGKRCSDLFSADGHRVCMSCAQYPNASECEACGVSLEQMVGGRAEWESVMGRGAQLHRRCEEVLHARCSLERYTDGEGRDGATEGEDAGTSSGVSLWFQVSSLDMADVNRQLETGMAEPGMRFCVRREVGNCPIFCVESDVTHNLPSYYVTMPLAGKIKIAPGPPTQTTLGERLAKWHTATGARTRAAQQATPRTSSHGFVDRMVYRLKKVIEEAADTECATIHATDNVNCMLIDSLGCGGLDPILDRLVSTNDLWHVTAPETVVPRQRQLNVKLAGDAQRFGGPNVKVSCSGSGRDFIRHKFNFTGRMETTAAVCFVQAVVCAAAQRDLPTRGAETKMTALLDRAGHEVEQLNTACERRRVEARCAELLRAVKEDECDQTGDSVPGDTSPQASSPGGNHVRLIWRKIPRMVNTSTERGSRPRARAGVRDAGLSLLWPVPYARGHMVTSKELAVSTAEERDAVSSAMNQRQCRMCSIYTTVDSSRKTADGAYCAACDAAQPGSGCVSQRNHSQRNPRFFRRVWSKPKNVKHACATTTREGRLEALEKEWREQQVVLRVALLAGITYYLDVLTGPRTTEAELVSIARDHRFLIDWPSTGTQPDSSVYYCDKLCTPCYQFWNRVPPEEGCGTAQLDEQRLQKLNIRAIVRELCADCEHEGDASESPRRPSDPPSAHSDGGAPSHSTLPPPRHDQHDTGDADPFADDEMDATDAEVAAIVAAGSSGGSSIVTVPSPKRARSRTKRTMRSALKRSSAVISMCTPYIVDEETGTVNLLTPEGMRPLLEFMFARWQTDPGGLRQFRQDEAARLDALLREHEPYACGIAAHGQDLANRMVADNLSATVPDGQINYIMYPVAPRVPAVMPYATERTTATSDVAELVVWAERLLTGVCTTLGIHGDSSDAHVWWSVGASRPDLPIQKLLESMTLTVAIAEAIDLLRSNVPMEPFVTETALCAFRRWWGDTRKRREDVECATHLLRQSNAWYKCNPFLDKPIGGDTCVQAMRKFLETHPNLHQHMRFVTLESTVEMLRCQGRGRVADIVLRHHPIACKLWQDEKASAIPRTAPMWSVAPRRHTWRTQPPQAAMRSLVAAAAVVLEIPGASVDDGMADVFNTVRIQKIPDDELKTASTERATTPLYVLGNALTRMFQSDASGSIQASITALMHTLATAQTSDGFCKFLSGAILCMFPEYDRNDVEHMAMCEQRRARLVAAHSERVLDMFTELAPNEGWQKGAFLFWKSPIVVHLARYILDVLGGRTDRRRANFRVFMEKSRQTPTPSNSYDDVWSEWKPWTWSGTSAGVRTVLVGTRSRLERQLNLPPCDTAQHGASRGGGFFQLLITCVARELGSDIPRARTWLYSAARESASKTRRIHNDVDAPQDSEATAKRQVARTGSDRKQKRGRQGAGASRGGFYG